jgi:integrase
MNIQVGRENRAGIGGDLGPCWRSPGVAQTTPTAVLQRLELRFAVVSGSRKRPSNWSLSFAAMRRNRSWTPAAVRVSPVRDLAIIRMLANSGARLSEVANLLVDDLDLDREDPDRFGHASPPT